MNRKVEINVLTYLDHIWTPEKNKDLIRDHQVFCPICVAFYQLCYQIEPLRFLKNS